MKFVAHTEKSYKKYELVLNADTFKYCIVKVPEKIIGDNNAVIQFVESTYNIHILNAKGRLSIEEASFRRKSMSEEDCKKNVIGLLWRKQNDNPDAGILTGNQNEQERKAVVERCDKKDYYKNNKRR